jgi:homoserine O-acetyltransferase
MKGIVALATSPRLTMQALAFDVVGRNAIRRDPHFARGQYYNKSDGPSVGLAIARMIGHITYLSPEAMKSKFEPTRFAPRDIATEFEKRFSIGSYLGYQGARFVERFDANSYVTLSLAMDMFDLGGSPEALQRTFSSATCRWLVVSFSSDWLFLPEQSREIVRALMANKLCVSYCNVQSPCGHDAFLLEDELPVYGGLIQAFLNNVTATDVPCGTVGEETHGPTSIFRQHRIDYDRIVDLTPSGASVLDLGCGSGGLLTRLRQKSPKRLVGVELDEQKILTSVSRGLEVIQADLNRGLSAFGTGEFDCVILSQTLQAVHDVETVITEMLRIGNISIVSIPNFAYKPLRQMLNEEGRAPKATGVLQHEWYDTPNVRFLSIADFEDFCARKKVHIQKRIALNTQSGVEVFDDPNLNADLAIFVISRNGTVG